MKKLFFILFTLGMFTMNMSAKVILNHTTDDGTREIGTKNEANVFNYKGLINGGVGLRLCQNDKLIQSETLRLWQIAIKIYANVDIEEGDKLLLKQKDGSIIELTANHVYHTTEFIVYSLQDYTHVLYTINEDDLDNFQKISKLRIQTSTDRVDCNVYSNKFTSTIKKHKREILDALNENIGLYDDF